MAYHYPDINQAALITHGGAAATLMSWTLGLPEILSIVSVLIALTGLCLQLWVTFGKFHQLEQKQVEAETNSKLNAQRIGAVEDKQTLADLKPPATVVVVTKPIP